MHRLWTLFNAIKEHMLHQQLLPFPSHHSDWIYILNPQVPEQLEHPKSLSSLQEKRATTEEMVTGQPCLDHRQQAETGPKAQPPPLIPHLPNGIWKPLKLHHH